MGGATTGRESAGGTTTTRLGEWRDWFSYTEGEGDDADDRMDSVRMVLRDAFLGGSGMGGSAWIVFS